MKTVFWKLESAGNDFVLLNRAPPTGEAARNKLVRSLCSRRRGVGSDGLVFIWKKGRDWNWRFFNQDGSETGMCGNAARAVALWIGQKTGRKAVAWMGSLGRFEAKIEAKNRVALRWPSDSATLETLPESLSIDLDGFNDRGLAGVSLTRAGVPHLVLINHASWTEQDRRANGPRLRSHPTLGDSGANVTWVSLAPATVVTFERGVEDETEACGSGAVAAALALDAFDVGAGRKPLAVRKLAFPGGTLEVRRNKTGLWLAGPANVVFKGELAS